MNATMIAFCGRALATSVGLFGLLRLEWIERTLLTPFTTLQAHAAALAGGGETTLARVGLNCSGADAIALCLAFIVAWPSRVSLRVAGALGGIAFISMVNIVRILTLVRMEGAPRFAVWHEYLWPAILTMAAAGYVFVWMSRVGRLHPDVGTSSRGIGGPGGARRFALTAAVCVVVFFAAAPFYLSAPPVTALAGWMAGCAAGLMRLFGAAATASGAVLETSRGGFHVTGECVATPVIPLGVAAALTLVNTWRGRGLALLALIPLVIVLGIARLLVLAVPPAVIGAPDLWVHAFFQMVLALLAIMAVAAWRHRAAVAARSVLLTRATLATCCGILVAMLLGSEYSEAVQTAGLNITAWIGLGRSEAVLADPQRALDLLPPFQIGMFVALTIAALATGWRAGRWSIALVALAFSQVVFFTCVYGLSTLGAVEIPVAGVRFWAILAPLGGLLLYQRWADVDGRRTYQGFWEQVGRDFPDLGGAPSTRYYFDNEVRLLSEHFPDLEGLKLLKTDLWDEAKNTRILQWTASRGARTAGIDIARSTIREARTEFGAQSLRAAAADVRALPFPDNAFDAVYSMGTIEHFDESDVAAQEIFRVLRPGGRAIIGVPNRWDPFLRPLQVRIMQRLGIYGYGDERSFSRRAFRELLEARGFTVVAETGILFVPGWLRMLDLACHAWCRPLVPLTAALLAPFVALDRRFPRLRRHGYLLATVVRKPERQ